jgi:hypothetical protein
MRTSFRHRAQEYNRKSSLNCPEFVMAIEASRFHARRARSLVDCHFSAETIRRLHSERGVSWTTVSWSRPYQAARAASGSWACVTAMARQRPRPHRGRPFGARTALANRRRCPAALRGRAHLPIERCEGVYYLRLGVRAQVDGVPTLFEVDTGPITTTFDAARPIGRSTWATRRCGSRILCLPRNPWSR